MLTTGAGNIRRLLKDAAVYIQHGAFSRWTAEVNRLYHDAAALEALSARCARWTSGRPTSSGLLRRGPRDPPVEPESARHDLLPVGVAGAGIQARHYARVLSKAGHFVAIFSYRPYWGRAPPLAAEWKGFPVFQSPNIREKVTDRGVIDFVRRYRIGTAILPETCLRRVFQIARLLRSMGVQTIGVPNIELVKRPELGLHRHFDKLLCNNQMTYDILKAHRVRSTLLLTRFAPTLPADRFRRKLVVPRDKGRPLRFLCIGGRNAVKRKQFKLIGRAFSSLKAGLRYDLTLTTQKPLPPEFVRHHVRGRKPGARVTVVRGT